MVALVSRTGRQFQRYCNGHRQVAGCIPYRFVMGTSAVNSIDQSLEVLVISSQNGNGTLFPKGGWETDETVREAARREALEEAGVQGTVKERLGKWRFESKRHKNTFCEGHMFSLEVTDQLDRWPEKDVRQRRWVTVAEARECCKYGWMKEALEKLVSRLDAPSKIVTTNGGGSEDMSPPYQVLLNCT